jgi:hypothetical protein
VGDPGVEAVTKVFVLVRDCCGSHKIIGHPGP